MTINSVHRLGTQLVDRASLVFRVAAWTAAVSLCVLQCRQLQGTVEAQGTGLVAAYGFDEGAGTVAADSSGTGNAGTIAGATWATSGMHGAALSFNGTTSAVTVPDAASLDLTTAMTLEAWVFPTVAPSDWRAIIAKDVDRYYLMAGSHNNTPAFGGTFTVGGNSNTFAPAALAVNSWTHLAATFDGTTVRLYVSGIQVATLPQTGALTASTNPLTIGRSFYGEYFTGLIDEVRIYNRALTVGEIQIDMDTPVSGPAPPRLTITQPAAGAVISGTTVNVGYTSTGDQTEVNHVHFQLDSNPVVMDLTLDGVYQFNNVPAGPHTLTGFLVRVDHSAIAGTNASVSFSTTVPDTTPPTAPSGLGATATGTQVTLNWTAATDNVGVTGYRVERCQGAGCNGFTEVGTATGVTYLDVGLAATTSYSYRVRASDLAGLLGPYSNVASATTGTAPAPTGLVAVYGFDEASGSTVTDTSGNNNTGTIAGATRTAAGKFGGALSFDGTTARVTVPDSASLDVTNAVTVEAWVMPSVAPTGWRSILHKDVDRYYLMASSDPQNRPVIGGTFGTANQNVVGTAVLPVSAWTHLAATYDRTTIRLYVNGVQVATGAQTAAVSTSTGVLTIGADFYGEYFAGLIDEVRIYNRALTAGEIATDMNTPVSGPAPPKLTITQPAAGATIAGTTVNVTYTSTGDQTGVDHVHFQLDSNPELMDLTLDGVYQFTSVPAGPHTLRGYLVRADHSPIPGTDSLVVAFTTTVPDTTPPTVSMSAPAAGSTVSGVITVSANASDNVGVAGVQFRVDGTNVGAEDLTSPFSMSLNTTLFSNGAHTLSAVARDFAGSTTVSTSIPITISNTSPTDPSQIGQWSAVQTWPIVEGHAVLMDTGDVLGWTDYTVNGGAQLWRPSTNTFVPKTYDPVNLFCSGHSFTADGRLFVAGGVEGQHGIGPFESTFFNPDSESWVANAFMPRRRYYPTTTTLGDGRIIVLGGTTTCATCMADIPDIYDPVTNTWTPLASSARMDLRYYPHSYVLPDGRILVAAQWDQAVSTKVLNLSTQTWSTVDSRVLDGHSSAMYLPGRVVKAGTASPDAGLPAAATTYVLDMTQPSPAWQATAPMAFPRSHLTMTILPDGQVLATGGGTTTDLANFATAVYEAEMWSPVTKSWTTLARMQKPRLYHSTALLLPDGRVLVAGGGRQNGLTLPDPKDQENAEFYSPPYLFKGPRPVISSAPPVLSYATNFTVATPDAARIASVSLIPLGAVTHSLNMTQRFVPLTFAAAGGSSLNVTAPINGNTAPPGPYMLFLVDTNGVPSVASMVRVAVATGSDTTPPTAPSGLTAGALGTQVTLNWTASLDNVGVTGYRVERCQGPGCSNFAQVASVATLTYVDAALAASTSYSYRVRATDAAGLFSGYSNVATVTTGTGPAPTAPVAAFGFDEASGSTVTDASGNSNTGTIAGATRTTAGKFGGALSFNGTSARVTVADSASLDLTNAMTLEAWVMPTVAPTGWRSLLHKDVDRYYLMASDNAGRPVIGGTFGTTNQNVNGPSALAVGAWTHLAATYDQTTIRLYVNGALAASGPQTVALSTSTGVLTIGADFYGEYFTGVIDEVRVYNRALTAGEIATDMNMPVSGPLPPRLTITQPAGGAVIPGTTVNVGYTSTGDQTEVNHVHFQLDSNPVVMDLTLDGVYQFINVPVGAHTLTGYLVRVDHSAIAGTNASVSFTTTAPDTTPPTAPSGLTASATGTQVTLGWAAATDNVGVTGYRVERCQGAGCSTFAEVASVTTLSYIDAGLAATTSYSYRVRATDAAGLFSGYSNVASATTGSAPTGVVAAYGFNEASGSTVTDVSGNSNTGTIAGATRIAAGKFGGALSFNGTTARVTVPDSTSLDLTNALTVEVWVMPSVAPTGWRSILHKDVDRYYLMASSDFQNRPVIGGTFGATNDNVVGAAVLPVGTWTHLAATYDRTTIRLYVNGVQVATGPQTAAVSTSNAVLTIGADFYGEYFAGVIDEVRIYNRALTAGEIQTDMITPVSGP